MPLRLSLGVLGTCALVTATCDAPPVPVGAPRPSAHADSCPRLDSRLFELTRSADPVAFAAAARLELDRSGVRVVIQLAAGAELPPAHAVDAEARYADLVQAHVPPPELCALAADPAVISVAPPPRGVPETARP